MKVKYVCLFLILAIAASCVSTKSTLKNVDNNAPAPKLQGNVFVITEYSKDPKYGYNPDYPINVFYQNTKDETLNPTRFLSALAGPKGEAISFKKLESCCPFPTAKSEMGAGFLDRYEITWSGQSKPIILYMNIYEKGALQVPVGFTLKKDN